MDGRDRDRPIKITEKGASNYLKMQRKAKGCQQKEICDGICSAATLSRIEAGEIIVDFLVIEALLSRLKLAEWNMNLSLMRRTTARTNGERRLKFR